MTLPSSGLHTNRTFLLFIPKKRLVKFLRNLEDVLQAGELPSGDAASRRARLFLIHSGILRQVAILPNPRLDNVILPNIIWTPDFAILVFPHFAALSEVSLGCQTRANF